MNPNQPAKKCKLADPNEFHRLRALTPFKTDDGVWVVWPMRYWKNSHGKRISDEEFLMNKIKGTYTSAKLHKPSKKNQGNRGRQGGQDRDWL